MVTDTRISYKYCLHYTSAPKNYRMEHNAKSYAFAYKLVCNRLTYPLHIILHYYCVYIISYYIIQYVVIYYRVQYLCFEHWLHQDIVQIMSAEGYTFCRFESKGIGSSWFETYNSTEIHTKALCIIMGIFL